MKKLLKILMWIAGIFILLIFLGVLGLYLFFPIEKVKDMAAERGSKQLNREISIGDAEISIWGGVGVKLNDVVLSNPPGDYEKEFLKAADVDVKLQFWPLLRGNYFLDRLILNRPEIYLKKNKDGTSNYSFEKLEEKVPPEVAEQTPDEVKPAVAAISFDRLVINDADIEYVDDSTGTAFTLLGMSLSSNLSMPGKTRYVSSGEIEIESLKLQSEDPLPDYYVKFDYDGEYDLQKQSLTFSIMPLVVNRFNFDVEGKAENLFTGMKADVKIKSAKAPIEDLLSLLPDKNQNKLTGYNLKGDVVSDFSILYDKQLEKPLSYTGEINIDKGRVTLESPYESVEEYTLKLSLDDKTLNVGQLDARTQSSHLSFSGGFENLMEYLMADSIEAKNIKPMVDASIKGDLNLAYLTRFLPAEGDPQLAGDFSLDMKLTGSMKDYYKLKPSGTLSIKNATYNDSLLPEPVTAMNASFLISPDTINVEKLKVEFVSTDVMFTGKLAKPFPYLLPFDNIDRDEVNKPMFLFRLNSRRFDFDKLFPEAVPGSGEETVAVSPDSVSFMILPDINGKGDFRIDTLIYSSVDFNDIKGDIKIFERKIECFNVTGMVYSGSVSGKTIIDLNDFSNPVYSGEFQASNIEANDFISRFTKFKDHLYGKFNLSGSYNARGWDPDAFLNSLTMDSKSDMKEGKLVTSGALYSTMSSLAEKMKEPFEKEQPLKNIATNIIVKDGKVSTDMIKSRFGNFGDVEVSGFYSFTDEISYQGTILLSKEQTQKLLSNKGLLGDLSSFLSDKSTERIKLPLAIGGTIDKPKVEIDYSVLMKKAGENLTEDVTDKLKSLFKKK